MYCLCLFMLVDEDERFEVVVAFGLIEDVRGSCMFEDRDAILR